VSRSHVDRLHHASERQGSLNQEVTIAAGAPTVTSSSVIVLFLASSEPSDAAMNATVLLLDLDHTLFDPACIPREVMEPFFAELRSAHARIGGVSREVLESSIPELMGSPITLVARKYGWPDELRRACIEASAGVVLPDHLPLFPDVADLIHLSQRKILVTTGVPSVQLQKIAALGLGAWLEAVHVDDALAAPRRGKQALFQAILDDERLSPGEVVVVGDSLPSEIAAGVALGMRTVHVARWGCTTGCPATHCMPDLRGVAAVL
jgi:FMN phosphatase YigB (HAD superfamily)